MFSRKLLIPLCVLSIAFVAGCGDKASEPKASGDAAKTAPPAPADVKKPGGAPRPQP